MKFFHKFTFAPFQINEEVEKLKALKLEMGEGPSSGGKLILKSAKGTRDYEPHMMAVREKVLEKVSDHLQVCCAASSQ